MSRLICQARGEEGRGDQRRRRPWVLCLVRGWSGTIAPGAAPGRASVRRQGSGVRGEGVRRFPRGRGKRGGNATLAHKDSRDSLWATSAPPPRGRGGMPRRPRNSFYPPPEESRREFPRFRLAGQARDSLPARQPSTAASAVPRARVERRREGPERPHPRQGVEILIPAGGGCHGKADAVHALVDEGAAETAEVTGRLTVRRATEVAEPEPRRARLTPGHRRAAPRRPAVRGRYSRRAARRRQ